MNVQFIGEPRYLSGNDTIEVDASADGKSLTVVVSEEALQSLTSERTTPGNVGRIFRDREDLFRDVVVDKIGLADQQCPDRLMILAADLSGRRY